MIDYILIGGNETTQEHKTKNYLGGGISLKDARREAGYTQEELAKLARLSHRSLICRIETGKRGTSVTKAVAICSVLGLPINQIKEFCNNKSRAA